MFEGFERLLPSIDESQPGVAESITSAAQRNVIRQHKQALSDFKAVTVTLQAENTTILDGEELFQSIIREFPGFRFEAILGIDASIVHNQYFENALIKIQSGSEAQIDSLA